MHAEGSQVHIALFYVKYFFAAVVCGTHSVQFLEYCILCQSETACAEFWLMFALYRQVQREITRHSIVTKGNVYQQCIHGVAYDMSPESVFPPHLLISSFITIVAKPCSCPFPVKCRQWMFGFCMHNYLVHVLASPSVQSVAHWYWERPRRDSDMQAMLKAWSMCHIFWHQVCNLHDEVLLTCCGRSGVHCATVMLTWQHLQSDALHCGVKAWESPLSGGR